MNRADYQLLVDAPFRARLRARHGKVMYISLQPLAQVTRGGAAITRFDFPRGGKLGRNGEQRATPTRARTRR
jgi:hypothetical protein